MSKCNIDLIDIKKSLNKARLKGKLNPGLAKPLLVNSVKDIINTYGDSADVEEAVRSTVSAMGLMNVVFGFESENELARLFKTGEVLEFSDLTNTDPEYIKSAKSAVKGFLIPAYGLANTLRLKVEKRAQIKFAQAMLINRAAGVGTPVRTKQQLNDNLRTLQQELLDTTVSYLREIYKQSNNTRALHDLADVTMYREENGRIVYTGAVEKVAKYAAYVSAKNHTAGILLGLERSIDPNKRLHLDAYNAWQTLTHFDSLLASNFGRALQFEDFGDCRFSGKNKYQWSTKGANQTVIFGNDEIDLATELNDVAQLLISTTELRKEGDGQLKEDAYLTLADVSCTIGKIKNLVLLGGRTTVIMPSLLSQLSPQALKVIQQYGNPVGIDDESGSPIYSLEGIINQIRENPQTVLPTVFELLLNLDITKQLKDNYGVNAPSQVDRNIIYSMYSQIFDPNSAESLNYIYSHEQLNEELKNSLYDERSEDNFYSHMCQACDTMFSINFMQYFMDNNGRLIARNMRNGVIDDERFRVENTIKVRNSRLLGRFGSLQSLYNVRLSEDNKEMQFQITTKNGNLLEFTVTPSSYKVIYKDATGQILSQSVQSSNLNEELSFDKREALLDFISNIIGLKIDDKVLQGLNAIENDNNSLEQLIALSCDVLYRSTLSNLVLNKTDKGEDLTKSIIQARLDKIYPKDSKNRPYVDSTFGEIQLVDSQHTPILNTLANYNSIDKGLFNKAQVKNGEGNTQSADTLSRLLSRTQQQWESQIKSLDRASARDFSLIVNPGLFRGIQVCKEITTPNGTKNTTDFTVEEFGYSSFIYDFIGGLMLTNQHNKVVGSNQQESIVAFIASVNSDKNTIAKLLVDLNKKVQVGDGPLKAIRDLSSAELVMFINQELGKNYTKVIENIQSDLDTLATFIGCPKIDYLNNFAEFKIWCQQQGVKPADFLNQKIKEWNKLHPNQRLNITDEVHYVTKGSDINANETLLSYYYRFTLKEDPLHKYYTSDEFWNIQRQEVLKSMLRAKMKFDLTGDQAEIVYLRNKLQGTEWIDTKTGEMYVAKVNGVLIKSGNANNISESDVVELNPYIEQHMLLDYLFTQEFMISTVGSCLAHPAKGATAKNGNIDPKAVLREEAARFLAQHKRNVSFTATMQEFQLKQLNGIPTDYNVAVIRDIKDSQQNIRGDKGGLKPFDGATFCNPFIVHLENNSLNSAKAGTSKKQFVHFYDPRTGTGGIIKTCGFGITNDWMRNSPFLQTMMRKMTDRVWLSESGLPIGNLFDFTKAVSVIETEDGRYEQISTDIDFSNCYMRRGSKFYKIQTIKKVGGTEYQFVLEEVSETGKPLGLTITYNKSIESNYQLWEALGGLDSVEISEKTKLLEPSEKSITKVVECMNRAGIVKINGSIQTQDDFFQPMKYSDVHYVATEGAVKQGAANINGREVYKETRDAEGNFVNDMDFMKIHVNQIGIQLDKEHAADHAHLSLMTQVINACAHDGFSSDRANQLYSALAKLNENGISKLLKPFKEYFTAESSEAMTVQFQEAILNTVMSMIATQDLTDGNLLTTLSADLLERARKGEHLSLVKDLNGRIPIDNNAVHAKFVSQLSVFLTNSGIRISVPGILSVLTPSFEIFKLYGNLKYEQIRQAAINDVDPDGNHPYVDENTGTVDVNRYLQDAQERVEPVFDLANHVDKLGLIREGREYQIYTNGHWEIYNVRDSYDYRQLKRRVYNGEISAVRECILNGRNLAAYGANFEASDGHRYNLMDLDSAATIFDIKYVLDGNRDTALPALFVGDNRYLHRRITYGDATTGTALLIKTNEDGSISINREMLQREFDTKAWQLAEDPILSSREFKSVDEYMQYLVLKEIAKEMYPKSVDESDINYNYRISNTAFELLDGIDVNGQIKNLKGLLKSKLKGLYKQLQADQLQISKDGTKFAPVQKVSINGLMVYVNRNSTEIDPYELVLPKTFIKEFGLDTYDQLDDIAKNPNFFLQRMKETLKSKITDSDGYFYDVELKRANGDHVYLLDASNLDYSIRTSDKFHEMPTTIIEEEGHYYIIDGNGEKITEVSSKNDRIFVLDAPDPEHQQKIIVTSNIGFFANNMLYTMCKISNLSNFADTYRKLTGNLESRIKEVGITAAVQEIHNKGLKNYIRFIESEGSDIFRKEGLNVALSKETEVPGTAEGRLWLWNCGITNALMQQAKEMHASFLKSLEVIGARIPAQSMQSFMPMKIVAFDNPNINTAHVNTSQIWYQGSDYDVDAVSIATFAIDKNGVIPLWSPFADKSSLQAINKSMDLPFPSGEKVTRSQVENDEDSRIIAKNKIVSLIEKYVSQTNLFNPEGILLPYRTFEYNFNALKLLLEEVKDIPSLDDVILVLNIANELGMPSDLVIKLVESIINTVNRHNMYLEHKAISQLNLIACNYAQYQMQSIIKDPMNLQQAQSSVDDNTGPLKKKGDTSEDSELVKSRAPGNPYNKYESIRENQVGKDGIAICATGLKAFFAINLYNNNILNDPNSTPEQRARILMRDKGVKITLMDGRVFETDHFANINPSLIIDDLSRRLKEAQDSGDTDAALILSAMLSLATDNAKELQLSKLNAGTKTIGMYLYGISIGMNFDDVADLMMSDIGKLLSGLMDGENAFLGTRSPSSINDVLNYLYRGPRQMVKDFAEKIGDSKISTADLMLLKLSDVYKKPHCKDINSILAALAWDNKLTLEEKISLINSLKVSSDNITQVQKFNQFKERICEYLQTVDTFSKNQPQFESLKQLAAGANEMRILGSILSLNQGLDTKEPDIIKNIYDIQNLVVSREQEECDEYNRLKILAYYLSDRPDDRRPKTKKPKAKAFDLLDFAYDPEYRKEKIEEYDKVKHSVNVLDCVTAVPHFEAYLKSLALLDGCLTIISGKYRAVKNISQKMIDKIGAFSAKDKETIIQGVQQAYSDSVINFWLKNKGIDFRIPGNMPIFENGELEHPNRSAETKVPIALGTNDGNASFKYIMEHYIIPNLLKDPRFADNGFISSLRQNLLTKTVTKNPVTYYTLPINMMPSTDEERAIFEQYKAEFNKLQGQIDPITGLPLTDLFALYGLIAHYGKQGQQSIMPILEDMHTQGLLKDFHEFETDFGMNASFEIGKDVSFGDLLTYCVPKDNPFTSKLLYLYYMDPETLKVSMYHKKDHQQDDYDLDEDYRTGLGDYELMITTFRPDVYHMYGDVEFNQNEDEHTEFIAIPKVESAGGVMGINLITKGNKLEGISLSANPDGTGLVNCEIRPNTDSDKKDGVIYVSKDCFDALNKLVLVRHRGVTKIDQSYYMMVLNHELNNLC